MEYGYWRATKLVVTNISRKVNVDGITYVLIQERHDARSHRREICRGIPPNGTQGVYSYDYGDRRDNAVNGYGVSGIVCETKK